MMLQEKDRWFDDGERSTAESDLDDLIFYICKIRACPTASIRSHRVV